MAFFHFVDLIIQAYTLLLFARIICSWVPDLMQYRVMQFVAYYTDPYLNMFRRFIPPLGVFDLSPIVAFLALSFARQLLYMLVR